MNIDMDLNNKIIVVAGVGGIGAATAKLLNQCGAKIVLIDINQDLLDSSLKLLNGHNTSYLCDFSKPEQIEQTIKKITTENGKISGLAYCVGVGNVRPLRMSKYDYMLNVMNINFFSFVEVVRCISLKNAYDERGLNIVGISAIGAFLGNSTKTAYCASKAAMNSAVRCMAKELAPKGIRINTIAPGVTNTQMAKASEEYGTGSKEHDLILARQYMGICEPEDIANAVVFLLSDKSRMITGQCLPVDGGKLSS